MDGYTAVEGADVVTMTRIAGVVVLTVGVAAGSVACSSSNPPHVTSPASPAAQSATSVAPAEATITISNFTFNSPPSVSPGATIAVKNSDPAEHSVTADSGNEFNVEVDGGATATFTAPSTPGTYNYHCSYHPMMHGQLIVK
jgi:plastocyanin